MAENSTIAAPPLPPGYVLKSPTAPAASGTSGIPPLPAGYTIRPTAPIVQQNVIPTISRQTRQAIPSQIPRVDLTSPESRAGLFNAVPPAPAPTDIENVPEFQAPLIAQEPVRVLMPGAVPDSETGSLPAHFQAGNKVVNMAREFSAIPLKDRTAVKSKFDEIFATEQKAGANLKKSENLFARAVQEAAGVVGPIVESTAMSPGGSAAYWQQQGAGSFKYEALKKLKEHGVELDSMTDDQLDEIDSLAEKYGAAYAAVEFGARPLKVLKGFGIDIAGKFPAHKLLKGAIDRIAAKTAKPAIVKGVLKTGVDVGERIIAESLEESPQQFTQDEYVNAVTKIANSNLPEAEKIPLIKRVDELKNAVNAFTQALPAMAVIGGAGGAVESLGELKKSARKDELTAARTEPDATKKAEKYQEAGYPKRAAQIKYEIGAKRWAEEGIDKMQGHAKDEGVPDFIVEKSTAAYRMHAVAKNEQQFQEATRLEDEAAADLKKWRDELPTLTDARSSDQRQGIDLSTTNLKAAPAGGSQDALGVTAPGQPSTSLPSAGRPISEREAIKTPKLATEPPPVPAQGPAVEPASMAQPAPAISTKPTTLKSLDDLTPEAVGLPAEVAKAEEKAAESKTAIGKVEIHGLPIAIETPKGERRKPEFAPMQDSYGRFQNTKGADGSPVDVFINRDNPESDKVYVVDQVDQKGVFDEFKTVVGASSASEAEAIYRRNYPKDWKGFGGITEYTVPEFKTWIASDQPRKARPSEGPTFTAQNITEDAEKVGREQLKTPDERQRFEKLRDQHRERTAELNTQAEAATDTGERDRLIEEASEESKVGQLYNEALETAADRDKRTALPTETSTQVETKEKPDEEAVIYEEMPPAQTPEARLVEEGKPAPRTMGAIRPQEQVVVDPIDNAASRDYDAVQESEAPDAQKQQIERNANRQQIDETDSGQGTQSAGTQGRKSQEHQSDRQPASGVVEPRSAAPAPASAPRRAWTSEMQARVDAGRNPNEAGERYEQAPKPDASFDTPLRINGHKGAGIENSPVLRSLYVALFKHSPEIADLFAGAGMVDLYAVKAADAKGKKRYMSEWEPLRAIGWRRITGPTAAGVKVRAGVMMRELASIMAEAEKFVDQAKGETLGTAIGQQVYEYLKTAADPSNGRATPAAREKAAADGIVRYAEYFNAEREDATKGGNKFTEPLAREAAKKSVRRQVLRWWSDVMHPLMLEPNQDLVKLAAEQQKYGETVQRLSIIAEALSDSKSKSAQAQKLSVTPANRKALESEAERLGATLESTNIEPPALKDDDETAAFSIALQWAQGTQSASMTQLRSDGTLAAASNRTQNVGASPNLIKRTLDAITQAHDLLEGAEVYRADSWKLIAKLPDATGLVADPSYFAKGRRREGTSNYGMVTEIKTPEDLLHYIDTYLIPAWKRGSRMVITNTWDVYAVRELQKRGFNVTHFERAGEERELVAWNFDPVSGELFPMPPAAQFSPARSPKLKTYRDRATGSTIDYTVAPEGMPNAINIDWISTDQENENKGGATRALKHILDKYPKMDFYTDDLTDDGRGWMVNFFRKHPQYKSRYLFDGQPSFEKEVNEATRFSPRRDPFAAGTHRVFHGGTGIGREAVTFFTDERHGAEWYAVNRGDQETPQIFEADVTINKPANGDDVREAAEAVGAKPEDVSQHAQYHGEGDLDMVYIPAVREELKRRGFDGVIDGDTLENTSIIAYIPFDKSQVKATRTMVGKWSDKTDKYRYRTSARFSPSREQDARYLELAKDPEKNAAELQRMVDSRITSIADAIRPDVADLLRLTRKQLVDADVFAAIGDGKVLNSIISAIPIDVMNDLGGKQVATEMLLHNQTMLANTLRVRDPNHIVRSLAQSRLADTTLSTIAAIRAELARADETLLDGEMFSTLDALQDGLIDFLVGLRASPHTVTLPSAKPSLASPVLRNELTATGGADTFHGGKNRRFIGWRQVPSADSIIYKDGKPVKLSDRFNPQTPDIRFSAQRDTEGIRPITDFLTGHASIYVPYIKTPNGEYRMATGTELRKRDVDPTMAGGEFDPVIRYMNHVLGIKGLDEGRRRELLSWITNSPRAANNSARTRIEELPQKVVTESGTETGLGLEPSISDLMDAAMTEVDQEAGGQQENEDEYYDRQTEALVRSLEPNIGMDMVTTIPEGRKIGTSAENAYRLGKVEAWREPDGNWHAREVGDKAWLDLKGRASYRDLARMLEARWTASRSEVATGATNEEVPFSPNRSDESRGTGSPDEGGNGPAATPSEGMANQLRPETESRDSLQSRISSGAHLQEIEHLVGVARDLLRTEGYDAGDIVRLRPANISGRPDFSAAQIVADIANVTLAPVIYLPGNANGMKHPRIPKTIFISTSNTTPVMATTGHELFHEAQSRFASDPEFHELVSVLDSLVTTEQAARYHAEQNAHTYGQENRYDMYGDLLGEQLTKPEFWQRLSDRAPKLFRWMAAALRNLMASIQSVPAYQSIERYFTDIEKARDVAARIMEKLASESGAPTTETQFSPQRTPTDSDILSQLKEAKEDIPPGQKQHRMNLRMLTDDPKRFLKHFKDAIGRQVYAERSMALMEQDAKDLLATYDNYDHAIGALLDETKWTMPDQPRRMGALMVIGLELHDAMELAFKGQNRDEAEQIFERADKVFEYINAQINMPAGRTINMNKLLFKKWGNAFSALMTFRKMIKEQQKKVMEGETKAAVDAVKENAKETDAAIDRQIGEINESAKLAEIYKAQAARAQAELAQYRQRESLAAVSLLNNEKLVAAIMNTTYAGEIKKRVAVTDDFKTKLVARIKAELGEPPVEAKFSPQRADGFGEQLSEESERDLVKAAMDAYFNKGLGHDGGSILKFFDNLLGESAKEINFVEIIQMVQIEIAQAVQAGVKNMKRIGPRKRRAQVGNETFVFDGVDSLFAPENLPKQMGEIANKEVAGIMKPEALYGFVSGEPVEEELEVAAINIKDIVDKQEAQESLPLMEWLDANRDKLGPVVFEKRVEEMAKMESQQVIDFDRAGALFEGYTPEELELMKRMSFGELFARMGLNAADPQTFSTIMSTKSAMLLRPDAFKKLLREHLAEKKTSLRQLIRSHYSARERTKAELAKKLRDQMGWRPYEALLMATEIDGKMEKLFAKQREQAKESFLKIMAETKPGQRRRKIVKDLLDLIAIGVIGEDDVTDAWTSALGIQSITPEQRNKIAELALSVKEAERGLDQFKVNERIQTMLDYFGQLLPSNHSEQIRWWMYVNLLSSINDDRRNVVYSMVNNTVTAMMLAATHPGSAIGAFKDLAKFKGLRAAIPEAQAAMKGLPVQKQTNKIDLQQRVQFKGPFWRTVGKVGTFWSLSPLLAEDIMGTVPMQYFAMRVLMVDKLRKSGMSVIEAEREAETAIWGTRDEQRAWKARAKALYPTSKLDQKRSIHEQRLKHLDATLADSGLFWASVGMLNNQFEGGAVVVKQAIKAMEQYPVVGPVVVRPLSLFIRIGLAIHNENMALLPGAGIPNILRSRRAWKSTGEENELIKYKVALMKQAVGLVALAAFASIDKNIPDDDDDEDELKKKRRLDNGFGLTAFGPTDQGLRRALMEKGWRPFSMKVGNAFVPYVQLVPAGYILALAGTINDFRRGWYRGKDKTMGDLLTMGAVSFARAATSMSMVQNYTKLFDVLSNDNTSDGVKAAQVLQQSVTSPYIPAVSALNMFKEWIGDTTVYQASTGKDGEPFNPYIGNILRRTPVAHWFLKPQVNAIGEVIDTENRGAFWTTSKPNPVIDFLIDHNGYGPVFNPPSRTTIIGELNAESGELPPSVYSAYAENAAKRVGSKLQERIDGNHYDGWKDERIQKDIKNVVEQARDDAKDYVIAKF